MFRTSTILAFLFCFNIIPAVVSGPVATTDSEKAHPGHCKEILHRKEWRTLDDGEKRGYIDAVKCLQSTPMEDPSLPTARTLFDVFQGTHMNMALKVHYVGQFLMWHRYYLKLYEDALRNICGYEGAHPYWNWTIDVEAGGSVLDSPIFDSETGFGGTGLLGTYDPPTDPDVLSAGRINPKAYGGCVQDGRFANYTLRMGPGVTVTEHCLTRSVNDTYGQYLASPAVAKTLAYDNYNDFRTQLEGSPSIGHRLHDSGHLLVSGEMSNFFSSPGDPLFYMHHGNLDCLWRKWQLMDPTKRMYEVAGPTTLESASANLTLDYILEMNPLLGPSVPVRDVMNTKSAPNCYTYI